MKKSNNLFIKPVSYDENAFSPDRQRKPPARARGAERKSVRLQRAEPSAESAGAIPSREATTTTTPLPRRRACLGRRLSDGIASRAWGERSTCARCRSVGRRVDSGERMGCFAFRPSSRGVGSGGAALGCEKSWVVFTGACVIGVFREGCLCRIRASP